MYSPINLQTPTNRFLGYNFMKNRSEAALSKIPGISQILGQAEKIVSSLLYQRSSMPIFISEGRITRLDRYDLLSILNQQDNWNIGNRLARNGFPSHLASILLKRLPHSLPFLRGIWCCPFFSPDGRVVSSFGYDPSSHIFLNFQDDFIPLPYASKELAFRSLERILKRLDIFSFQNEESRSAALAALISCIVRPMLPSAPLFAFSSSDNTAKNYIQWIAKVFLDKPIIAVSPLQNKKEESDRLLALLFEGNPLITFDRISRYGQTALDELLCQESSRWFLRKEQKIIDVPILSLFFSLNTSIAPPLSQKTLFCFFKPQRKTDEWIEVPRREILTDCINLLMAYQAEGLSMKREDLLCGFESWDVWVRGLLLWINMTDPFIKATLLDPISQDLKTLFELWFETFEGRPIRIKHLLAKSFKPGQEVLRNALIKIAPGLDGDVNTRILGKKLSLYEKRSIAGFYVQKCGLNQGAETWKVFREQR